MFYERNMKFVVGAALAFSVSLGSVAEVYAKERRMHSSSCTNSRDDNGSDIFNGSVFISSRVLKDVYCPVVTDSYLAHNNAARLNVHGSQPAGGNTYSRACVKHYNNAYLVCGDNRFWGADHAGGANLDLSAWQGNPSSFPYVYTFLPKDARFFGYWYRD